MFKNEYKDVFGATYTSKVWDKAQKANNWSMAFALFYALSKNGMNYASATTGACSVIRVRKLICVKVAAMVTYIFPHPLKKL